MTGLISLAGALILAAAGASPTLSGAAIARDGNDHGAPACATCHGGAFQGDPETGAPALAGRPAQDLVARLDRLASPSGKGPTMKPIAAALTPAERRAVATYLARLPRAAGAH